MRRRLEAMRSAQSYPESPKDGAEAPTGFELIKALFPVRVGAVGHVLALELPQLSK